MILGFSTQLNGKPTYFVEKIWQGLLKKEFNLLAYHRFKDDAAYADVIDKWDYKKDILPKLHTIREDKTNLWQAGMKIDFFINVRKKNMFRFAPVLPVVSVQKIEIIHQEFLNDIIIKIDGKIINTEEQQQLAWNDGFDNLLAFLMYFNEDFIGKIIHWTDLKY